MARKMGSPAMLIGQVASQDALEMPRLEDDHGVQTLPGDTPVWTSAHTSCQPAQSQDNEDQKRRSVADRRGRRPVC